MWFKGRILAFSFMLSAMIIHGGFCDIPCLNELGKDSEFFNALSTTVANNTLEQPLVDNNKNGFYSLFNKYVWKHCSKNFHDLNQIADNEDIIIPFTFNGQKYDMQMKTARLFEENKITTAFLVCDKKARKPGDILNQSDMSKDWFFTTKCSTHHPRWNVDNTDPINRAGQAAFYKHMVKHQNAEFFLDQPVNQTCRAFPGLVRGDYNSFYGSGTGGDYVNIITDDNYQDARKSFKTFAAKLQRTNCSGQGLYVYHVSIEGENTSAKCSIEKVTILSNGEPIN